MQRSEAGKQARAKAMNRDWHFFSPSTVGNTMAEAEMQKQQSWLACCSEQPVSNSHIIYKIKYQQTVLGVSPTSVNLALFGLPFPAARFPDHYVYGMA